MTVRFARLARIVLPASARTMPWIPIAAVAAVSTLLVGLRHGQSPATALQAVAIILTSVVGFAFDDPAAEFLAASPSPLLRRRLLRLLPVGPPVVLLWIVLVRWRGTEGAEETLALMLLFVGLFGLSVGVAGVAARRSHGTSAGIAVPPAIFALLIVSSAIPARWRPLPLGDVPGGWAPIYVRWAAAAVLGTIVFLVSSRDPAARRLNRGGTAIARPSRPR